MSAGQGGPPVIAFAEVPAFYAEVERAADATLRERPVLVGGDPRKRGKVQSASAEACRAGVVAGMPMLEALALCPRARVIKTDMQRYRDASAALRGCLRSVCEALEPEGLAGAFFDLRGAIEEPEALAVRLLQTVACELGLPLRVGIGPGKLVARLAAEESGTARWRYVRPADVSGFLASLSVERLPHVGPKTAAALHALAAHSVGDLVRLSASQLEPVLGRRAPEILALARGEDPSPVRVEQHGRSLSRECSFEEPETDATALAAALAQLAGQLAAQLERQGLQARRVAVKVRTADAITTTRSCTLTAAVATRAEIYDPAASLLARSGVGGRGVRSLALTLAGLAFAGSRARQLDLFSADD